MPDAHPSPSSLQLRAALLKILRVTTTLPAQFTLYTSAFGAVALMSGGIDLASLPPALAAFAASVGANTFAEILSRVARGEADEQAIRAALRQVIAESGIAAQLTDDRFQRGIEALLSELQVVRLLLSSGDSAVVQRLYQDSRTHGLSLAGEPAYVPPTLFIRREDMLARLEGAIDRIERENGLYLVAGAALSGKTALLRRLQQHAAADERLRILYADFKQPGSGSASAVSTVIEALWLQLLAASPAAARFYASISDRERPSAQLVYLKSALHQAAREQPVLLLLDNLQQDTLGIFRRWLREALRGQRVVAVVTQLQDAFHPLPEDFIRHVLTLTPLQPRELKQLFTPENLDAGWQTFELSNGEPEVIQALVDYWLAVGIVTRQDEQLAITPTGATLALPDLWEPLVESRLTAALEDLELEDYEYDDLLDWLTAAAVLGATFNQAGLVGATGEDIPPETSAMLLQYLADGEAAILKSALPDLPLVTTYWQFKPAGLYRLLLEQAHAADVVYYAQRAFDALERAAHPEPFQIRARLLDLADTARQFELQHLQAQGATAEEIRAAWSNSEAAQRVAKYQGYQDREAQIHDLELLLSLIGENDHRERWPVLRQLGEAMRDYSPRNQTGAVYQSARISAVQAQAPGEEIANLYYCEAMIRRDDPAAALALLREGWGSLPPAARGLQPGDVLPPTLFRQLDRAENVVLANILTGFAVIYSETGQPEQARLLLEQALPIMRQLGSRNGEAATLNNLAHAYRVTGYLAQARALLEQALPIHQALGNRVGEAATLRDLANVYRDTGQLEQTRRLLEQALPIARHGGDRAREGGILTDLAAVYIVTGQPEQARLLLEQALLIQQVVGDRKSEGMTLNNLANVYHHIGQPEQAQLLLEQALRIARQAGDRTGEATTLHNLASVYHHIGQPEQALLVFEQALWIHQAVGDRSGEATTLENLANVYHDTGQPNQALRLYAQALSLFHAIGQPHLENRVVKDLGVVLKRLTEAEISQPCLELLADVQALQTTLESLGYQITEQVGEETVDLVATLLAKLHSQCGDVSA